MGTIKNVTASGDPISDVTVVGFPTPEKAFAYFTNGFPDNPDGATFQVDLERSQATPFEGDPYVVFWHIRPNATRALLSITQCFGDLSLGVGSVGNQYLLSRNP